MFPRDAGVLAFQRDNRSRVLCPVTLSLFVELDFGKVEWLANVLDLLQVLSNVR